MKSSDHKKSDAWYFPPDMLAAGAPMGIIIVVLMLEYAINWRPILDATHFFYTALALGVLGALLLFFARLPLYRQGSFFTFGPKALSAQHRKLYYTAYALIGLSTGLLVILLIALNGWPR